MENLNKICELYQFDFNNEKILEQEVVKNIFPNIKIDSSEMIEKYRTVENYTILLKLCQFLDNINRLQIEAFNRNKEIEKYKQDNNLSRHQTIPMDDENWAILHQEYNNLLDVYGTNKLMRYSGYYSSDPKYNFINTGCIAKIIMKSNRKVIIEFAFLPYYGRKSLDFEQFTLVNSDNNWLVDKRRWRLNLTDNWQTSSL